MYGATLEQAQPWIEAYRVRLASMFEKITACFPGGCEIYIGDIYDPTDGVGDAPSVYLPDGRWISYSRAIQPGNPSVRETACARTHRTTSQNIHGPRRSLSPVLAQYLCRQRSNVLVLREHRRSNDRGYDAIRRVFLNTIVENTRLRSK